MCCSVLDSDPAGPCINCLPDEFCSLSFDPAKFRTIQFFFASIFRISGISRVRFASIFSSFSISKVRFASIFQLSNVWNKKSFFSSKKAPLRRTVQHHLLEFRFWSIIGFSPNTLGCHAVPVPAVWLLRPRLGPYPSHRRSGQSFLLKSESGSSFLPQCGSGSREPCWSGFWLVFTVIKSWILTLYVGIRS